MNNIEQRIDKTTTGGLAFGANQSMSFSNMNEVMEFAKIMAISGVAVPKHLRETPGACLAVAIQAMEWQMSPFAVANKSYSVNDRLAFEAQLVNAVILRRAPIVGRFAVDYAGAGEHRTCTVSATLESGETVSYTSPETGKITVKNSPQWKSDPDQQLFYFASRAMCRRHFPDVLLGVYTQDELEAESPRKVSGRVVPAESPFAPPAPAIVAAPVEVPPPLPDDVDEAFALEAEIVFPQSGTPEEQLEWLLNHHSMSEDELFGILHGSALVPTTVGTLPGLSRKTVENIVKSWGLILSERKGGAA